MRISAFSGSGESAVKIQIPPSVRLLVATVKKRLALNVRLYNPKDPCASRRS